MSNHGNHDVLEAFVVELASAGTSAALREQIAGTVQRWSGARGLLFLERTEAGFAPTLAHGVSAESLAGHGPLVRWLRVNNEVLVFQDRPTVVSYLSADERAFLERVGGDACVPMVMASTLVVFMVLCHVGDRHTLSARRALLEAYATRAAEAWQHLIHSELQQARRDALGHSHRLGVAGQLAATVAHEVRNPLAAIRSLVQFARDTPLPADEQVSILSDVLEEVDRIDQTVTGMLHLSQPSASRHQSLDLCGLVRSVSRFVRAYAQRRCVMLAVEAPEEPIQIQGDHRELRQVVTNLLLNAFQACDSGGRVVAVIRRTPDSSVEIEISDNGAGILPEHLARVFDPFFTTKPQGTGLGLQFCRDVTERHGGTIGLTSALGEGTSVRVRLPVSEVDELPVGG